MVADRPEAWFALKKPLKIPEDDFYSQTIVQTPGCG